MYVIITIQSLLFPSNSSSTRLPYGIDDNMKHYQQAVNGFFGFQVVDKYCAVNLVRVPPNKMGISVFVVLEVHTADATDSWERLRSRSAFITCMQNKGELWCAQ